MANVLEVAKEALVTPTPVNLDPFSSKPSFVTVSQGNSLPSLGLKLKYVENKYVEGKVRFEAKDCLDLEKQ